MEALDLPLKPEKIAIVSGGYIALEFAGIFNGLKSGVHEFIRQKKVLRGFDEEVRDFVGEQMSLRGIEFHTEESPQSTIKSADGSFSLKTNKGSSEGFSLFFLQQDTDLILRVVALQASATFKN
ncbi:hypothetical protein TanjilG_17659 [Lupinus angustifolius]|uniref:glutathione-disulfide reductase n=1 Tax=Lupinus angustifolius TaxID=3871 RepID=A0A1J7H4V8_LUPAN|nr:hypothetical protein TanjilG_17659 [Lupinus angustifolius]